MRGRLTEQLSAAALRTARLQQATSMLAEALTVLQVVEVITEVGRSAIGAERSAVALLDPERLRLRTINPMGLPDGPGAPSGDIPLDVPERDDPGHHLAPAGAGGEPGRAAPAVRRGRQRGPVPGAQRRAGLGRAAAAGGGRAARARCGSPSPSRARSPRRSGSSWRRWPGQCALALERASLFEREHTTAETLQRSLLPDRLPSVPGIILEARYLPVTRNMEIGGDWYDAFRLPDGRLAVATGDVMGKGLTAAAGMGRVRNALRALALTDPRPAAVLAGPGPAVHRHRTGRAGDHGRLPGRRPGHRRGPGAATRGTCRRCCCPGTPRRGWTPPRRARRWAGRAPGSSTCSGCRPAPPRCCTPMAWWRTAGAAWMPGWMSWSRWQRRRRPGMVEDPARLLEYLVDRMLTGYEQDDDVTVLVLHVPRRDGAPAQRAPVA